MEDTSSRMNNDITTRQRVPPARDALPLGVELRIVGVPREGGAALLVELRAARLRLLRAGAGRAWGKRGLSCTVGRGL